jgi:Immunoglobulin-like domain of bacterial spore germination/Sporulation and spore germination
MHFRAVLRGFGLLAVALIAGGCLHDEKTTTVTVRETVTETATGTVPNEAPAVLTVFLVDEDEKVAPTARSVVTGPAVARAALNELLVGPEDDDLETAIPPETELANLSITESVADVVLSGRLSALGRAQVVYTLTQFPTVKRVAINGARPVGRAAFEQQTPAILVESPLPDEDVEPGFEAAGTANTFEATFNYELRDEDDNILKADFVTATSGSGTRGTFRFTVPYEVDRPQEGSLTVFEISAADGSRTHESSIPLRLR